MFQFYFSPFAQLRFLSLATIKSFEKNSDNKNSNFNEYNSLFEQLINYVDSEYVNGALFLPNWVVNKLNRITDSYRLEALSYVLGELSFDELVPIEDKIFEFSFMNDELEDFFRQ